MSPLCLTEQSAFNAPFFVSRPIFPFKQVSQLARFALSRAAANTPAPSAHFLMASSTPLHPRFYFTLETGEASPQRFRRSSRQSLCA